MLPICGRADVLTVQSVRPEQVEPGESYYLRLDVHGTPCQRVLARLTMALITPERCAIRRLDLSGRTDWT